MEQQKKIDFRFFMTTFSLQAAIALGEIENPVSRKKEEDLNQAMFIIEVLGILKEKTTGNLTFEEKEFLDRVYIELKAAYDAKISRSAVNGVKPESKTENI
ncbi:MAG: DUF1844 domain-containing protein [Candidatus Omnitrophica bacterium]|nr:DUF1844 domain-containing protein [Candidatus Omnitrophota bacterium]